MVKLKLDYRKFDYYVQLVKEDKELTTDQKETIIVGFGKLREVFGDAWLDEAINTGHPLSAYIYNTALWSRLWLTNVGLILDITKDLPGQIGIVSRLKNANQFEGAYFELQVTSRLKTNGFYIEINPEVDGKHADILARKGDETLYVEVTGLKESKEERKASWTFQNLTVPFFSENILISCKIHRILSNEEILEYQKRIKDMIRKANLENRWSDIQDDSMDYFVGPQRSLDELRKWQQKTEVRGIEGLSIIPEGLERVVQRVRYKSKQLPHNYPGILWIYCDAWEIGWFELRDYLRIANRLQETIRGYPQLAYVVLQTGGLNREELVANEANCIIIHRRNSEVIPDTFLILKNQKTDFQIKENTFFEITQFSVHPLV